MSPHQEECNPRLYRGRHCHQQIGTLPLAHLDRATQLAAELSSLVQVIKALPEGAAEQVALVQAYADALKVLWITMAGFAFVALIASLFTESLSIDRRQETEQGLQDARH